MRIALYLSHYPAPGGTTAAVSGYARAFEAAGHEAAVLSRREFGRTRARRLPWTLPRFVRDAARVFADFDVVVLNGIFHPDLPALARAARRSRVPYVVAPHGPYHPQMFARSRLRKRVYFALAERRLLRDAAAVQVLSETQVRLLRALGIQTPAIVAPYGIDVPQPVAPRPQNGAVFGFLGRLDAWHKGLDILLDAFASARTRLPGVRLVLKGPDWGDRRALERRAGALGVGDAVTFEAPEPTPSPEVIGRWDALVLPSRYDAFPVVTLEALAVGRPVVCSTESGTAEHVERATAGMLAEPTERKLADALVAMLERRAEWPAMGSRGRDYARTHLTWRAAAETAAAGYEAVLAGRAP